MDIKNIDYVGQATVEKLKSIGIETTDDVYSNDWRLTASIKNVRITALMKIFKMSGVVIDESAVIGHRKTI